MKRSTAKLLMVLLNILTLVGGIIVMVITKGNKSLLWAFAGVMVVISLILGSHLRCRHCGRGQGKAWLWASHCPHCGEPLDD